MFTTSFMGSTPARLYRPTPDECSPSLAPAVRCVNGKIRHDAAREPTRCRTAGVSRGARARHRRVIAGKTRDAAEARERACPSTMLGAMRHVTRAQFREEHYKARISGADGTGGSADRVRRPAPPGS